MNFLRKYFAFTTITFRNGVQYRFSFTIYILGTTIQLAVLYFIWRAVYVGKPSISGFTESEMITYLFISQILNSIYAYRNSPERIIFDRVKNGNLAFDLIKPVRFSIARLMENIGEV